MIDPAARRRRRMVLAALVVVCLVLVTAGFGASGGASGGPLGALNEGASKIFKPVRDLVHWVGDTADAKGQNEDLRREVAGLRTRITGLQADVRRTPKMAALQKLDRDAALETAAPVAANVIGQSPTAWASTIVIDKGTGDGIETDQAVVGSDGKGAGLVGFVTSARPGSATVSLLPTPGMAVGARLDGADPVLTVLGAGAGARDDLELWYASSSVRIRKGALVTTSGTTKGGQSTPSKAPANLPIGRITRVSKPQTDDQIGHLKPLVDLRKLEIVQVLTRGASPSSR
ncbi:rod shape-determining protein MreC [Patulibacter sp. SYSU D01012]|uniref:rod shape-determining protein MreC n=1 Tax=Patulibacter sp. SYSU D01012 TaxID=2817381 RepID=UPI001B31843C